MTPGSEADPLRELLHHMTARYLTVRSGGFEFEGKRALQPALVAELLGYGSARSLYRGRRPVCRSLDGIRAIEDPDKNCGSCLDRKHCTPQVRLDILVDHAPYRLLLAYSSARNFLLFIGRLGPGAKLDRLRVSIRVVDRASWGEIVFGLTGQDHARGRPQQEPPTP